MVPPAEVLFQALDGYALGAAEIVLLDLFQSSIDFSLLGSDILAGPYLSAVPGVSYSLRSQLCRKLRSVTF